MYACMYVYVLKLLVYEIIKLEIQRIKQMIKRHIYNRCVMAIKLYYSIHYLHIALCSSITLNITNNENKIKSSDFMMFLQTVCT